MKQLARLVINGLDNLVKVEQGMLDWFTFWIEPTQ